MATDPIVWKHLADAGLSPTPPLTYDKLNDHKITTGVGNNKRFVQIDDALPNGFGAGHDGATLINAPLRQALVTSSAAISGTTAPTATLFNKGVTLFMNHANVQGSVIVLRLAGRISTKATGPGSAALSVFIGSTPQQLFSGFTSTTNLVPGLTNYVWTSDIECTVRAAGPSGAILPSYGTLNVPTTTPTLAAFSPSITVNLTANQAITAYWTWSVADATNSVVLDHFTLRVSPTGAIAT